MVQLLCVSARSVKASQLVLFHSFSFLIIVLVPRLELTRSQFDL